MKERQVYVIEWKNKRNQWETWEIHGTGGPRSEGGGLAFYKRRLRQARRRFGPDQFRLVRYVPDTDVVA